MKPTLLEDDAHVKQSPDKKARVAYAAGAPASTSSACDFTAIVPLEDDKSAELR